MHKVFIIAEAGVNHNGKIELAKKLIDVAVAAGADAVKFQTFNADMLVSKWAPKADYQKSGFNKEETQYEMIKRLVCFLFHSKYYIKLPTKELTFVCAKCGVIHSEDI